MPPFSPPNPTGPYVINGNPLEAEEAPGIRKELRDFKNEDAKAWNLYLLGLWQFQLVPQDKVLSYFQIAEIHGVPYKPWPENDSTIIERARKSDFRDDFGGFCTHSSILFLTWHRPYLALFEDVLRQAMVDVAGQFTDKEGKQEYLAAAKRFWMPFWDWARPDLPVVPNEATSATILVEMPENLKKEYPEYEVDGGLVKIPNPLYSYKFPPGTDESLKIDHLETTTRHHRPGKVVEIPEQEQDIFTKTLTAYTNGQIDGQRLEVNIRERMLYILQSYQLFSHISMNKWEPMPPATGQDKPPTKGTGFGSFEDIHNTFHDLVGGFGLDGNNFLVFGHMTDIAISSFDPLFWLHHGNIDRLLALWQGLCEDPDRPSAWVTPDTSQDGNWATAKGGIEDNNTDLLPFYKAEAAFWKSRDVHDTTTFGYAYPETFKDGKPTDSNSIKESLRQLYTDGSLANIMLAKRAGNSEPETTLRQRAMRLSQIETADAPNTSLTALRVAHAVEPVTAVELNQILDPLPIPTIEIPKELSVLDLVKGERYLEWLVNIKAEKHALGGSYRVHVFLGTVPPEEPTALYPASPFHVGTFSPFGQSRETACGKCRVDQAARLQITGQIPLTLALVERYFAGKLPSLDVDCVKAYLQENLHWEVIGKDGKRLKYSDGRNKINGLLVGVVTNEVTLPSSPDGFPRYSDYVTVYPEITTKADPSKGGRAEGTGVTEETKHDFGQVSGSTEAAKGHWPKWLTWALW